MGFLRRVHGVRLVTNCTAVKLVEPWMSSHFFESRELSHVGSVKWAEYSPGKIVQASPVG